MVSNSVAGNQFEVLCHPLPNLVVCILNKKYYGDTKKQLKEDFKNIICWLCQNNNEKYYKSQYSLDHIISIISIVDPYHLYVDSDPWVRIGSRSCFGSNLESKTSNLVSSYNIIH